MNHTEEKGKSAPKISVIIPVFNAEDNLRETLHSVLSQGLLEEENAMLKDQVRELSEGNFNSIT